MFSMNTEQEKQCCVKLRIAEYGNTGCRVGRDTKLERFLPKNRHDQRKLSNLENWSTSVLSKIGHYFKKYSNLKIDVIKKCQKQKMGS